MVTREIRKKKTREIHQFALIADAKNEGPKKKKN
jgi:hypothetical protein